MEIIFVSVICAAVSVPLIVAAWAMKRQQCPHCGETVEPDPRLVRMFIGE